MDNFEIKEIEIKQKRIYCKKCNNTDVIAVNSIKNKDKVLIFCESCSNSEYVDATELRKNLI
jgi:RNase P subunit RPR2